MKIADQAIASVSSPRRKILGYAFGVLLLVAAVAAFATAQSGAKAAPMRTVKGGNISAWNIVNVSKVFADAQRLGLDTITVPVRVKMSAATASSVSIDPASLAFAKNVMANSSAYNYIIEPYPWIANGNVPETDLNPADMAAWFASYQTAVVTLAREFPTAAGIYVASNLIKVENQTPQWIALIKAVRGAFAGKIIYRTQWWVTAAWAPEMEVAYKAKLNNALFGEVDIIAIAAYFELTDVASPSQAQIKSALRSSVVYGREQDVYAEVMALQTKWQKPIFLGELSCPAVDLGAQTPWDPSVTAIKNTEIQKNYLAAYLETFATHPNKFMGFSIFTIGHPKATPYDLAPSAAEFIKSYRAPTL